MTTEHTDPDRVYSDDPKGADSSPMSELQRNALAFPVLPPEYSATVDELENTVHMISSCAALLGKLEEKRDRLLARLSELEARPGIPAKSADVSTALAEHTQPALEAIEQASQPGIEYIEVTPSPEMRAAVLKAAGLPDLIPADPFAGIPNSDDSDNERL